MNKTKQEIRQRVLAQRDSLGEADHAAHSASIAEWLADFPAIADSAVLCTYLSKDSEVNTLDYVARRLAEGCRIFVPVALAPHDLQWCRLHRMDDLTTGSFGVLEPRPEKRVTGAPPGGVPVIVPGVAFTPTGDRLGYGRGYFDSFLQGHDGLTLGLAYECQMIPSFPTEPHDVALDFVVTEKAVYGKRAAQPPSS